MLKCILLWIFVASIYCQVEIDYCRALIEIAPQDIFDIELELTITFCGLFPFLPPQTVTYPKLLRRYANRGIGIWQYPTQFARYLNFISHFPVSTYVEIGVAAGGSFIFTTEFLRKYNPLLFSYAVDIGEIGYVAGWEKKPP